MKNLLKFLTILSFVIFVGIVASLLPNKNNAYAAPCSFSVSDTTIDSHGSFSVTITGNVGTRYAVRYSGSTTVGIPTLSSSPQTFPVDVDDLANIDPVSDRFTVSVAEDFRGGTVCTATGNVEIMVGSGAVGSCTISRGSARPGESIKVTARGLQDPFGGPPQDLHPTVNIDPDPSTGQPPFPASVQIGTLNYRAGNFGFQAWEGDVTIPAGIDPQFEYLISIDPGDHRVIICSPSLAINTSSGTPTEPGVNPCAGGSCPTAIGNLGSDLTGLAQSILTIGTGLAGGIALIFMVIGSIRILTSSGDQQRLNAGREIMIAAISGLLFIILSVLILRFIGINVLNLEGFLGS